METYDPHKNTKQVRQSDDRRMNGRVLVISTLAVFVLLMLFYVLWALVIAPGPGAG